MLKNIRTYLNREGITLLAPVLLHDCRITRPYLLEREGIADGTAIIFAVPYATPHSDGRNVSAYAAVRDYHIFFRDLFASLLPALQKDFPNHRFAGFSDHSPIDEIHAALIAGLGVKGDNGLLLTELFSSYVFIGEIITDAILPVTPVSPAECLHCGACRRACPVALDKSQCLSALTQKKGDLTEEEYARLDDHPLVWGCDSCQEACPYTVAAGKRGTLYETPPFFQNQICPALTVESLDRMDEETFRSRAYSWRGRAVIRRNLLRKEEKNKDHIT